MAAISLCVHSISGRVAPAQHGQRCAQPSFSSRQRGGIPTRFWMYATVAQFLAMRSCCSHNVPWLRRVLRTGARRRPRSSHLGDGHDAVGGQNAALEQVDRRPVYVTPFRVGPPHRLVPVQNNARSCHRVHISCVAARACLTSELRPLGLGFRV